MVKLDPKLVSKIDNSSLTQEEKERMKTLLLSIEATERGVFVDPIIQEELNSLSDKAGF